MKRTILSVICSLVFLAIFNVIFFVAGIPHSDSNWLTYGFVSVAFMLLTATPLFCLGSQTAILKGSLWMRGTFYFFTEVILAAIFFCINPDSITWPLIIQGVLLAIFIIMQLMSVMANDSTTESLNRQKNESFARNELIDKLKLKSRYCAGPEARKLVYRCIEALSNTPIQSFPGALDAELGVKNAVDVLSDSLDGNDTAKIRTNADKLLNAIQIRNVAIKNTRQ